MKFTEDDMNEMFQEMDSKAPVEFKEEYWNEVSQMLNKKKKKVFPFWLNVWFLIPLLALPPMIYFGIKSSNDKREPKLSVNRSATNSSVVTRFQEDSNRQNFVPANAEVTTQSTSVINYRGNKNIDEVRSNEFTMLANEDNSLIDSKLDEVANDNEHLVNNLNTTKPIDVKTPEIDKQNISVHLENEDPTLSKDNGKSEEVPQKDLALVKNDVQNPQESQSDLDLIPHENMTQLVKPRTWRMFVGASAGLLTNMHLDENSYNAGVFRIEYGVNKSFGRFFLGGALAIENSFGKSVVMKNLYTTYDQTRNEHTQEYAYNRFTNFAVPIQLGVVLGKNQKSTIALNIMPEINIYNNVVYSEKTNDILTAHDEYFDQTLGIKKFYMNFGLNYSYLIVPNVALGVEYNNNFGTNFDKQYLNIRQSRSNHQFMISVRYFIK